MAGEVNYRGDNKDLRADLFPGYQSFLSESNLKSVLESAGSSLESVVKTTVFLTDMAQFAEMNAVYAEFFTSEFPARSAIQVAALPKGGIVEVEAIAVLQRQHAGECDCE